MDREKVEVLKKKFIPSLKNLKGVEEDSEIALVFKENGEVEVLKEREFVPKKDTLTALYLSPSELKTLSPEEIFERFISSLKRNFPLEEELSLKAGSIFGFELDRERLYVDDKRVVYLADNSYTLDPFFLTAEDFLDSDYACFLLDVAEFMREVEKCLGREVKVIEDGKEIDLDGIEELGNAILDALESNDPEKVAEIIREFVGERAAERYLEENGWDSSPGL